MKSIVTVLVLLYMIPNLKLLSQINEEKTHWVVADHIIKNIEEPEFPAKVYSVTSFGAVGDGIAMNTEAINAAIDKCNAEGGGQVLISNGDFLTGPVHMKSNVELRIDSGAVLRFSTEPSYYLPLVRTRWEGVDCYNYSPLIYANGQTNFAITGKGTLDGQGSPEHWWSWKGSWLGGGTQNQLIEQGRPLLKKYNDTRVPVEERQMGEGHYLRPQFISFIYCTRVRIEDITIINSPFWVIHPILSESVLVRNVTVNSMGPNNDGCDPESCKNVLIEKCTFNTGDDCIALKSGRNFDGREADTPIENIIIRDCNMKNGHGGVAIGSEISGGCKNIFIENCRMNSPNLDRAIRIKTNSNRGGVTNGVYVRNVEIGEVRIAAISINCSYHINVEGEGEFPPLVKNIYISDLTSEKAGYALWLQGIDGRNCVEDIYIYNCKFSGVQRKNEINNVKNLTIKNVQINGE